MTLDTRIFIYDSVDHMETFEKVCELLDIPDTKNFRDEVGQPYGCVPGREISNEVAQGFDAWVMTYSNPEGIRLSEEYLQEQVRWNAKMRETYPDEADDIVDPTSTDPEAGVHFMQISMDTGYGGRSTRGESCTELHARVIAQLGQWLDERGLNWGWYNEYNGKYYSKYDGLNEFLRGGLGAMDWFQNLALPAIQKDIEDRSK